MGNNSCVLGGGTVALLLAAALLTGPTFHLSAAQPGASYYPPANQAAPNYYPANGNPVTTAPSHYRPNSSPAYQQPASPHGAYPAAATQYPQNTNTAAAWPHQQPTATHHATAPAAAPRPAEVMVVRSSVLELDYAVQLTGGQTQRIELWYARGNDPDWQLYGYDDDLRSPVRFVAPGEGLYRLLIVAVGADGQRSCPTDAAGINVAAAAQPHAAVFMDYTKPQLYLLSPESTVVDHAGATMRIGWNGFDSHAGNHPVALYYQRQGDGAWREITRGLGACGEYVWEVPPHLSGTIIINAVMTDRAGNIDNKLSNWIALKPSSVQPATTALAPLEKDHPALAVRAWADPDGLPAETSVPAAQETGLTDPVAQSLSATTFDPYNPTAPPAAAITTNHQAPYEPVAAHTQQPTYPVSTPPTATLPAETVAPPAGNATDINGPLSMAELHSQRGEWSKAAQTYRQALTIDPTSLPARVGLGDALYELGRYQEAYQAYDLVLTAHPQSQVTLYHMARTQYALGEFTASVQTVDRLLRLNPQDWQAWLLRGDAAERLGNRNGAVESWRTAAQMGQAAGPDIVQLAQQRINRYRP